MDQTTARAEKLKVTFLPKEVSTRVPAGTTLFHAAAWTGQPVESTCGGRSTCGKCRVLIHHGAKVITPADLQHLSSEDIEAGWRLSCQQEVRSEMVVEVPRLLTTPKTAMFGVGRQVLLDPNVHKVHLRLVEPSLHDQRSDYDRIKDALREEGFAMKAGLGVLRTIPKILREADFEVTAVLCGDDLVALEPGDTTRECCGVAFDLGTTTIVGSLLDLNTGENKAVASALNAQAIHGGDVLSRISHTMGHREGLDELQRLATFAMNGLLEKLAAEARVSLERIYEVTIAGNMTMMHLLLGIDPEPISVTPFTPTISQGQSLEAREIGIAIHPHGRVYLFPAIGAYVGGDIVAGLLATALPRGDRLRLFVDVGTNGEIALGHEQRTVATAAPAGPAFEGAEISCGMRATTGAIEGVTITEDAVVLQTIDDAPPIGLCGSGLIDAVAQLYKRGLMDAGGRMRSAEELAGRVPPTLASRLITVDGVRAFVLATADTGIPNTSVAGVAGLAPVPTRLGTSASVVGRIAAEQVDGIPAVATAGGGLVPGWADRPALNQYACANYRSAAACQQWAAADCSAAALDWLLGAYGVRLGGIDDAVGLIGPGSGISTAVGLLDSSGIARGEGPRRLAPSELSVVEFDTPLHDVLGLAASVPYPIPVLTRDGALHGVDCVPIFGK